ncbi:hypothetical protein Aros01_06911 [Streptosporangium roseum]
MGDQLGALGLVLNAVVLFNTRYMDAALTKLRVQGFTVRDEDVARLSPFIHAHVHMLGRYSFALPDLPGVCDRWVNPPTPMLTRVSAAEVPGPISGPHTQSERRLGGSGHSSRSPAGDGRHPVDGLQHEVLPRLAAAADRPRRGTGTAR